MIRLSVRTACTLFALTLLTPARGDDTNSIGNLEARIHARMEAIRTETGVPGISVGFVLEDGRRGSIAVGVADVENRSPLTPNHLILAGSIGKTFAAAVTLQLVQEGKLQLNSPISKWLGAEPWFLRLPNANTITLRMLMRHQSGIREHVETPRFVDALYRNLDRRWSPSEIIEYALDQKPLFEAGKGWSYADTNYILVGMIVEKVNGRRILDEIDRRMLKPLKLMRTRPSDRRSIPQLATGYSMPSSPFRITGPVIKDGKLFMNPQMEWTGGGFASTPLELARWAKELYEGSVLSSNMKAAMLEGVPARTGRGDKYGLGVQIRESAWGISYGHGGWFPGYLSEMEYFPEKKTSIAVQITTDDMAKLGRRPRALVADVAKILMSEGAPKPTQRSFGTNSTARFSDMDWPDAHAAS